MITKEATQKAYWLGAQKALTDTGMLKSSAIKIPEPVLQPLLAGGGGAALGALSSPLSENVSPAEGAGLGALMGLGALGGHHLIDRRFQPMLPVGMLGGVLGGGELGRLALGKSREDLNFAQPSWTDQLKKSLGIP